MAEALSAASAPPFEHDADDHLTALELQRQFEQLAELEAMDEAMAYSFVLDDSRRVHEDLAGSLDFVEVKSAAPAGKPPPHCSCCLSELAHKHERRVMPCGHLYCVKCIRTRCKMGVRDRALVPAHCCKKEFPDDYVKEALAHAEWTTYQRFVDEKEWGAGGDEQLVSDAEYAEAMGQHGFKQCPKCGVGVEKISGCNAIRCLRGHLFCFACGNSPCTCKGTNLAHFTFYQRGLW